MGSTPTGGTQNIFRGTKGKEFKRRLREGVHIDMRIRSTRDIMRYRSSPTGSYGWLVGWLVGLGWILWEKTKQNEDVVVVDVSCVPYTGSPARGHSKKKGDL